MIRGRVQGVGFRWYAREEARRGDLAGWVRNSPDGSVEIAAAGDPASVNRFIEAMRRGPPGARVEVVDSTDAEPEIAAERPFGIRR